MSKLQNLAPNSEFDTLYFKEKVNLSRGQELASANKKVCTWKIEYFEYKDGFLRSFTICEDGFTWESKRAPLPVPRFKQPSNKDEFTAASIEHLRRGNQANNG